MHSNALKPNVQMSNKLVNILGARDAYVPVWRWSSASLIRLIHKLERGAALRKLRKLFKRIRAGWRGLTLSCLRSVILPMNLLSKLRDGVLKSVFNILSRTSQFTRPDLFANKWRWWWCLCWYCWWMFYKHWGCWQRFWQHQARLDQESRIAAHKGDSQPSE